MIKTLQTSKFFEDLFTLKVDAVVTVGNFSLAKRLGTAINQVRMMIMEVLQNAQQNKALLSSFRQTDIGTNCGK